VAVAIEVTYCSPGRASTGDGEGRHCDKKYKKRYFFGLRFIVIMGILSCSGKLPVSQISRGAVFELFGVL